MEPHDEVAKIQEQRSAAPQIAGFDYQFFYFVYLLLELRHGEKVGFEVKDDVHIDKEEGTTVLFQAKHTVLSKADGTAQNLTSLDQDLWKTLSAWCDLIKADPTIMSNHSFNLVTNKSVEINDFIDALNTYHTDGNLDALYNLIVALKNKTTDTDIKSLIRNVINVGKRNLRSFFEKLKIETDDVVIVKRIKTRIFENIRNEDLIEAVFDSLTSNLLQAKYLDTRERKNFEISFEDFNRRFGKCFRVALEHRPLPKRNFPIVLPEKLEDQIFIKQLIDIGEVDKNSPKIIRYTTYMLKLLNHLSYWLEEGLLLPNEVEEFTKNSILKWENEFTSKFRRIRQRIIDGESKSDLEPEIKYLALELLDHLKRENLSITQQTLEMEMSNGHFYALSDKPEIGWHIHWEEKYKGT